MSSAFHYRVRVPSFSTAGRFYKVESWVDGITTCECPRAGFAGKTGLVRCSHVQLAEKAHALIARCEAAHARTDAGKGFLCRQCLVSLLALTAGKVRRDYVTKAESKLKVAKARAGRKKKRKGSHAGTGREDGAA